MSALDTFLRPLASPRSQHREFLEEVGQCGGGVGGRRWGGGGGGRIGPSIHLYGIIHCSSVRLSVCTSIRSHS